MFVLNQPFSFSLCFSPKRLFHPVSYSDYFCTDISIPLIINHKYSPACIPHQICYILFNRDFLPYSLIYPMKCRYSFMKSVVCMDYDFYYSGCRMSRNSEGTSDLRRKNQKSFFHCFSSLEFPC